MGYRLIGFYGFRVQSLWIRVSGFIEHAWVLTGFLFGEGLVVLPECRFKG